MKCYAAHYIYLGRGEFLKNQVICLDDRGYIRSFEPLSEETASTLFFNGVLCAAFGFSGTNRFLSIQEGRSLLNNSLAKHPQIHLIDFLQNQTNDVELEVGSSPILWCIDLLDLKKLIVTTETTIYSVFP